MPESLFNKVVDLSAWNFKLKSASRIFLATDSCRDGWNIRNGSKILHSVGESVVCALLLALVLLLSKHNYVILFWTKSIASVFVAKST